jgi:hypothetical protein
MANSPLLILETRDTGGNMVIEFGITPGFEREAAGQLVEHMRRGAEVWLRNDLDEGGEGCTQFRYSAGGYVTAVFGHGWSNRWKPIEEQKVRTAIVELADLNRATHAWADRGSIHYPKTGRGIQRRKKG